MNLTDELRKLAELRNEGQLTDQEFAAAKKRLLSEDGREPSPLSKEGKADVEAVDQIAERTFRSSRWSSGNLFFPDSLTLASDGMLFRKGAMFGSSEEHINYRAVASFRIKNGLFLSDVCIETSGGSQPIFVNGLWKSGAKEIQDTISARTQ
jgi:Short C-terminal domain